MIRAFYPSHDAVARCLFDLRDALDAIRNEMSLRMESVAWPGGLDRAVLQGLPLKVRTRNCLLNEKLMEGDNQLTVNELLSIRNFGRTSLQDLLFTVEEFLKERMRAGSTNSRDAGAKPEPTPSTPKENTILVATVQGPRTSWECAGRLLSPLLATAAEVHGVKTLAEALDPELLRLANRMGIAGEISALKIDDLARETPGLVSAILLRLARTLDSASETERTIIEQRLLSTRPTTLASLGTQVGVTRERIRQVQARIETKIRDALGKGVQIIATTLKERFGHVVLKSELEDRIEEFLSAEKSLVTRLLRKAVVKDMGFTLDDGLYLDRQAKEEFERIRDLIPQLVDDVGLVDKQRLVSNFPSEEWKQRWPWVHKHCGLKEFFGAFSIRDSDRARVKAALLSIGRPATRKEIARECGFSEAKAGSHLSGIPSVGKADKQRWGLREWIDDEYTGIVDEIIQRIEEDGGVTTTKKLLTELPGKFGVTASSVRTYMNTRMFVVRDGWISLANKSSVRLRELDDVIDGRDHYGAPYWTFRVEARFFDGYSATGVPPEFANALGCGPDDRKRLRIENLPDCPEISLVWSLASTTDASLGCLAEPLTRLGIKPGQRVRVTVRGRCLVELSTDDGDAEKHDDSEATAILQRLMERRRVP